MGPVFSPNKGSRPLKGVVAAPEVGEGGGGGLRSRTLDGGKYFSRLGHIGIFYIT